MNRALKRKQAKLQQKRVKDVLLEGSTHEKLTYGAALHKQKNYPQALRYYQNVLNHDPMNVDALYLKGATLMELQKFAEAKEALQKCIQIQEATHAAHHNLGVIYLEEGAFEEAIQHFTRAQTLEPKNQTTAFFLERAKERNNNKSSQPYIQTLYDAAAPLFEDNLVKNLQYDGPQRLMQRLVPHLPEVVTLGVDLGCGTGLMGLALKGRCKELYGIDLAKNMLKEAAKKEVYTHLEAAPLEEFLAKTATQFELITAADVFIYIGPLEETFKGAKKCLAPGGLFAFTTETLPEDAKEDLWLDMANNRHKHKNTYLKRLAAENGFKILTLEEDFLRHEKKQPVTATYVVLQKG